MTQRPISTLLRRIEHRLLRLRARSTRDAPLVIGGTGGSGTRVAARLCEELGVAMGTWLNAAHDALAFVPLYDRWIGPWWALGPDAIDPKARRRMEREVRRAVARHRASLTTPGQRWSRNARWGWKNPRSLYLLSYLDRRYPAMRFLHVVRDGRDMAFSSNQAPVRKDGAHVLDDEERQLPPAHQAVVLWNRVNLAAARYGEACMGDRYLRLRYEDLCARPDASIARLMRFLDVPGPVPTGLPALVRPPDSLGRWQDQPAALTDALIDRAREGLTRFGYLPAPAGADPAPTAA